MKARLVLEDGRIFYGESFGCQGEKGGEVVFNTGMTGYQEIMSDPSYCGQIVVLTYPLIGNYGINPFDFQSKNSLIKGLIVREYCDYPNHWQADYNISDYLKQQNIIGLSGIDTRALTKHLRNQGTMRGIISTVEEETDQSLIDKAKKVPSLSDMDHVMTATTKQSYEIHGNGPHVALLDLGCKSSIIQSLQEKGCRITVLPAKTGPDEILAIKPDGLLLSNGPGDPKKVPYVAGTVKSLLGKLPIFGICLGHQVLGLSLGGDTYKLKFGHRGTNHPVKDLKTEKVFITSQNHGYALKKKSIENLPIDISHINLNDHTVEGMRHKELPLFSVQFHPEGSPGPYDSIEIFKEFLDLILDKQKVG
ncbi:glutamine-hydrolyzing carbamoyl-phosphate synthase small subunit [Candidatus Contubernalis alkaliaceticus]|uniref:glutamine-hydrolyzing carbamoyl-phosphate synthase small subunit n=1 Tax=Candidatus Contubernalis alkaliaceticus TaxID=338645 RepID=UPI001F4BE564|nr:glutamine-hydrolyzing carbamoyl-phosphate synthase small subunit [Candidatus Contubernalis alkalaceticus]UNC91907.1 glutamine-hydrolyzing carbamoyl-phosphate synthase small subunit [Candidatus Contubernalis alkalaceticus]